MVKRMKWILGPAVLVFLAGCYQPPFDITASGASLFLDKMDYKGSFEDVSLNNLDKDKSQAWFIASTLTNPTSGFLVQADGIGNYNYIFLDKTTGLLSISNSFGFGTGVVGVDPGLRPSGMGVTLFPTRSDQGTVLNGSAGGLLTVNTLNVSTKPVIGGGISFSTGSVNNYSWLANTTSLVFCNSTEPSNLNGTGISISNILNHPGSMAFNNTAYLYSFWDGDKAKTYRWTDSTANPPLTQTNHIGIVRCYLSNGYVVFDDEKYTYFYKPDDTLAVTVPKGTLRFVTENTTDSGITWVCQFSVVVVKYEDGGKAKVSIDVYTVPTSELDRLKL